MNPTHFELFKRLVDASYCIAGVTSAQLFSHSRLARICRVRSIIAHILRENGCYYEDIGLFLNRSHSAIIASIKAYEADYSTNKSFRELADSIAQFVNEETNENYRTH